MKVANPDLLEKLAMMASTDTLPVPPGAPEPVMLLKKGRGLFQPDLWLVDTNGRARVWKTWRRKSAIERFFYGARLARREGRILQRLEGMEGVPRFLAHPDPWTLEMTLLDAEPVPEIKGGGGLAPIYFDRLWEMLSTLHEKGINHGDLRRKNLMRAPGDPETPRMLDFTQSFSFTPPLRGLRGFLMREAIRIDRVTFLKLKRWYIGRENLTATEIEQMEAIPWHLSVGRFMRKKIYRPVKHLVRGKKRPGKNE